MRYPTQTFNDIRRGARTSLLLTLLAFSLHCSTTKAGLLDPSALIAVTNTNVVERISFAGVNLQNLTITGLQATSVAEGVAVVNNRLFVGVVSQSNQFSPRIAEVNPATGAVINTLSTSLPNMTALGDDGTNLLLLNAVNAFDAYTYTPGGTLVSLVHMQRPFSGNVQAYGIDGDGQSIFTSYYTGSQPIVTNTVGGAAVSLFATNMSALNNTIGGLAYDETGNSFWVAGTREFRHYSSTGNLLATIPGTATVTGLEVLPTPEPSTFVLTAFAALFLLGSRVCPAFKRVSIAAAMRCQRRRANRLHLEMAEV